MDLHTLRLALLISLAVLPGLLSPPALKLVRGATVGVPLVSVWSDACRSSNITITNGGCGGLAPGTFFQVEINVTNAPTFNAYEFYLYYDQNYLNATSFDLDTGTVFETGNPGNLVQHPFSPPGTVHLAVVNNFNPPSYTGHDGTLAHITFNILKIGVSPLVFSASITNALEGGTRLLSNTVTYLVATSNGFFNIEPVKRIKFIDSPAASSPNSPGTWFPGKTIIYDADNTGTFTAGDFVMNGTAPAVGADLSVDYRIKFVTSPPASSPNSLGIWAQGDTIVYDRDVTGTYSIGGMTDTVVSGAIPALGTNLSVDSNLGPVARFTYSPAAPRQGDIVTFNATSSFDPDGGLFRSYQWEIGSGGPFLTGQTAILQVPISAGNFSIRLTVTDDDDNFEGMQVQSLTVASENLHDMVLETFTATPSSASPGDIIMIRATVLDEGLFSETYNISVSYSPPSPSKQIATNTSQTITSGASTSFSYAWNTTGLSPGFYTLQGVIYVAVDNDTSNNSASITIQILGPPPSFDFSLSNPSPNSLTVVQGSTSPLSVIETSLVSISPNQYPLYVVFSTSPLPRGVTAIFISGNLCLLNCTVALYFSANATAALGTFTIGVTANETAQVPRYGAFSHSTSLSLTVTSPRNTAQPKWPAGSSLVVSDLGSTGVTLSWNAATDSAAITGYRVYANGSLISTIPGDQRSYDVTGLVPGTVYVFKVEAGDTNSNWTSSGPSVTAMTSKSLTTSQTSFLDQYGSQLLVLITAGALVLIALLISARALRRRSPASSSP